MDIDNYHITLNYHLSKGYTIDVKFVHFFTHFAFPINLGHRDKYARSMEIFLVMVLIMDLK